MTYSAETPHADGSAAPRARPNCPSTVAMQQSHMMSPHIRIGPEHVLTAHVPSPPAAGSHCPAREDSAPHCGTEFSEIALWEGCYPISPPPHANSFVLGPAVINTHTVLPRINIGANVRGESSIMTGVYERSCSSTLRIGWGLCVRLCLVLICRNRYGLGVVVLLFILGSNLGGVGPERGLRGERRLRGWCEELARRDKDHPTFSYH